MMEVFRPLEVGQLLLPGDFSDQFRACFKCLLKNDTKLPGVTLFECLSRHKTV